jgi:hypothetical protein
MDVAMQVAFEPQKFGEADAVGRAAVFRRSEIAGQFADEPHLFAHLFVLSLHHANGVPHAAEGTRAGRRVGRPGPLHKLGDVGKEDVFLFHQVRPQIAAHLLKRALDPAQLGMPAPVDGHELFEVTRNNRGRFTNVGVVGFEDPGHQPADGP